MGEIPTAIPTSRPAAPPPRRRPRLVGREAELARLERALDRVDEGRSACIGIVGEPGIGKTSLLNELRARAEGRGWTALGARAASNEQGVPYGVLVAALDDHLVDVAPLCRESLAPEVLAELGSVFASLRELGAPEPPRTAEERFRTHRAIKGLLELLATERPLLLALDDMHWADDASLELVGHLLRNPPRAPVLTALVRRSGALTPARQAALDSAARVGDLERIEPRPLTLAEAELMLSRLGRTGAEAAHRRTGGNPFYLEQLAGQPGAVEPAGASKAPEAPAPEAIATALAEEIESLGDAAHLALRGGAVAGDPFEPDLAARAAELDRAALLDSLQGALARGLVRRGEDGRRLGFRHPIVHHTIYSHAPDGWRLEAHARVERALAARGAPPPQRAHHVARAAQVGDQAAVALLAEAGGATRVKSPASAAVWYREALRLLGEEPASRRLELLEPMAMALAAAGEVAGAHAALEEALGCLPADASATRTRLSVACAGAERLLGRHGDAKARLGAELERAGHASSPEALSLLLGLTLDAIYMADWPEARELAADAHAAAEELADSPGLVTTSALTALASHVANPVPQAVPHLDAARELADALSDEDVARRIDALTCLCMAEYFLNRFADSEAHADRCLRIQAATGQGFLVDSPLFGRSMARLELGRIVEARDDADAALDAARLEDNPLAIHGALLVVARAATAAGELARALEAATEMEALAERIADARTIIGGSVWARAVTYLELGLRERCEAELVAGLDGPDRTLIAPFVRCRALELLVACALERGDLAEAQLRAERIEPEANGLALGEALAVRARGAVQLAQGDARGAAALAREAAAALDAIDARLEADRARILAGRALAADGEHDAALAELGAARERLDAGGALRFRDQAARELRRLGVTLGGGRQPGAAEADLGSLSPREREIAEHAATGRTNGEIAGNLFVSEKTVEKHLSSAYAKLGVPGRAALGAALAAEEDEAP